ncbi:MAG: M1 family metallopeptidase [Chloroflexota bacterium]
MLTQTPTHTLTNGAQALRPYPTETDPGVSALTATLPAAPTFTPTLTDIPLTPTGTPAPVGLPEPPEGRTRYVLQASLDYARHSLSVEEQVTYTNTTPDSLEDIPLVVEARRYPGAFNLKSLRWADGQAAAHLRRENQIVLPLAEALAPGAMLQFQLSYELTLPDITRLANVRPYPLGYTDLQANFGDWYPFIPPYRAGEGWLAHPNGFYGEHLVYEIADFEVSIRSTLNPSNLVFAASAPAQVDGEWQRYQSQAARSFAWSASPYYQVITQTVELASGSAVTLASYAFPFFEEASASLVRTMAQAVPLYTRLYGERPLRMLSAVQVDFLDGMEYDGLFMLSRDFYNWHKEDEADFLAALGAHESAHQWFYALVGNDQALQPWLDEALCTYSERLYYENTYPQALEWWWTYRIYYYEPKGYIDISIYDVPAVAGQYRAYRDTIYLNGSLFIEELRTQIGDTAFFEFLRDYVRQGAYRQATAADFFAILGQHASLDLAPLLRQYFDKDPLAAP